MSLSESLALALTGERVAIDPSIGTVEESLRSLARHGWDVAQIAAHAQRCWDTDSLWPHTIAVEEMQAIGPARWSAVLSKARASLKLETDPQPPSKRTTLNSDELRLLQDLPPHHGSVG